MSQDRPPLPDNQATRALIPFSASVLLGYLAVGIPLPVLPLRLHDALGFGPVVTGFVIGLQSLVTLLTRQFAGRLCAARGTKYTTLLGFALAALSGPAYLASTWPSSAGSQLALIAVGRVVLGIGESLFITGNASWSVARVGPAHAGRALTWQGMAMYGALAAGAPLGSALDALGGFAAVALAVLLLPVLGGLLSFGLPAEPDIAGARASFLRVLGAIWPLGAAVAVGAGGYGTIAAFLALLFQASAWGSAGLALTGFGIGYILVRLLFSGLADRVGGMQVAFGCLAIEAVGEAVIAAAPTPLVAAGGTVVAGLGYALLFPSLGVAAIKRLPQADRGVVLGAFLAFFDLGIGGAGPVAGLVVAGFGLRAAFAAIALGLAAALLLTWAGRRHSVSAT